MRGSFDHHEDHADRQTDGVDDDDWVFGDDDDFGDDDGFSDGDDFGDDDGFGDDDDFGADDDFGDDYDFGDDNDLVMTHDHIWPDFPSGRVMSKPRPLPDIFNWLCWTDSFKTYLTRIRKLKKFLLWYDIIII